MADSNKYLDKERAFNKNLQDLKSAPVEMVDDFQKAVVKDLPVEKINTVTPQKIKSGGDFLADQLIRNSQKEAKMAALGKIGDTLDYSKFKTGGKKLLGAVPLLGAAATFATTGDASAAAAELPGDVPVIGQAYEAIRPETAGNAAEDMEIINEIKARQSYENSPAHLARIKALQGIK